MKTLKAFFECVKAIVKCLTTSTWGRISICGCVIMGGLAKLIIALIDVAFDVEALKAEREAIEAEASETNTETAE